MDLRRIISFGIATVVYTLVTVETVHAQTCAEVFPPELRDISRLSLSTPDLISRLSADPRLKELLESKAGVWEDITVLEHVKEVFGVFEGQKAYFQTKLLPTLGSDVRWLPLLRATIALHDIGKPIAVQKKDKHLQHQETVPILRKTLVQAGFTQREVNIAVALVRDDWMGEFVRGRWSPAEAQQKVLRNAKELGLSPLQYFRLQALFYTSDAVSYAAIRSKYFIQKADGHWEPTSPLFEKLSAKLENRPEVNRFAFMKDLVPADLRHAWSPEQFTDPTKHDPSQFRYIVHCNSEPDFYDFALRRQRLDSYAQMDVSVIDESHINTFSGIGVIIKVPPENIVATRDHDMMASEISTEEGKRIANTDFEAKFARLREEFGLDTPAQVLGATYPLPGVSAMLNHNDIFLTGVGPDGRAVEIEAVFVRTDSLGEPLARRDLVANVEAVAKSYNVPILHIGPPKGVVMVRVEARSGWTSDFKMTKSLDVYASEAEFRELERQAAAGGRNLVGVTEDFILAKGAFFEGAYWGSANADSTAKEIGELAPAAFRISTLNFVGRQPTD